jgi:hypothetical protein
MPVDALKGLKGIQELSVRLGYELCDSRACSRFDVTEAKVKFAVPATPAKHDLLAYRIDSQRVAIVTEKLYPAIREPAELVRALAWAYVIMDGRGYESESVWVLKYSPTGPRDAGIAYGFGC